MKGIVPSVLMTGLLLQGAAIAAEESAAAVALSLPAQPLRDALNSLARETGLQVIYTAEAVTEGLTAPGLDGRYTPQVALRTLLEGSGLRFEFLSARTVAIMEQRSEAAAVDAKIHKLSYDDSKQRSGPLRLAQSSPVASDAGSQVALEEIIVSAQKQGNQRLQDVPVAVSALSAQSLEENNRLRIQDFSASVPGFAVSPSPSAGGQQMLAIRGISTGFNTNPTVGVTVDDMPFGSSTNLAGNVVPDIDPSDLARIEVLRGPQGALYGASSMGGLLRFVTVDPSTDAMSGRLSVGTVSVRNGDSLGYNIRGVVNVPLSDTVAIRASAFTREDPGYIDNPVLGIESLNEARVNGGRFSALWTPSDALSLKLSALYQRFEGDGTNDVNILPGLGDLQQNYIRGVGAFDRETQAYSATITARPGRLELTSVTGYNRNDFSDSFDFSYALGALAQPFGMSGAAVFTDSTTDKFTQEIRASLPLGERVDWLIGGFYTDEDVPFTQEVLAMDPATGAVGGSILLIDNPQTYREYAGFTDFTFHLSDRVDLQVGGRQSRIERTALNVPDAEADAFTYLVTPSFKISPDLMVYARAASGYRAGGQNTNPDPTVPRQFDPDKTKNYEIGIKGSLADRAVSFDASLYYIDWTGLQLNLLSANNNITYTTNVSRAKSQGIELAVQAKPIVGLTIAAWGTYNDAVLTEDTGSSVAFGLSGDRLPYGSRISGQLALTWEFAITGEVSGLTGGAVTYTGDRIGTFVASPLRQQYPSYTTVDLRTGATYESWTLSFYANNVGDERGILGGGVGTFPPFAFSYIQPRTIGLSVAKSF